MRWLAVSSVVVVFSASSFAAAQGATEREVVPETEGADEGGAQEVFELGRRAAADGRYADAARYFERAYQLSPRAVLLYNIGISYERADQSERAIEALERYLASGDELPRRTEVEERLRVLRAGSDGERGSAASAPDTGGRSHLGPFLVVGSGVVLAGLGAVFLGLASSAANKVTDAAGTDVLWTAVEGDAADASTFSVLGGLFLGLGAVVLTGGLIWLVAGDEDGEREVAISVAPNGIRVRGTF